MTVTTGTVKLLRANNTEVPINVAYTPSSTQITIMPRVTLSNGTYRVTVTTGMRDAGQCAGGTVHHQLYHRRSATSGLCADDPTVILVKRGAHLRRAPPLTHRLLREWLQRKIGTGTGWTATTSRLCI
ncbi:Ig-like domain-containing protein [Chloroflexus sp.]|uniref:Ig-like domain-containing protein n=1 Tax=Chloroflexus sp. TaxID=1904827 RepID=UPI003A0FFA3C